MPDPDRKKQNVVLLGGGFLGSQIARRVQHAGRDVTVLTRSEPEGYRAGLLSRCRVVVGDIGNGALLRRTVRPAVHIIYALGALHPYASNFDPTADVSTSLLPLLSVLKELGEGQTCTFLSSGGTVYGDVDHGPTPEEAPTNPLSSYGIMKLAGEKYTSLFQRLQGIQPRILRIGNVYGPGQQSFRGQGVIGALLDCAESGTLLQVYGDGSIVRDYIHVEDVSDAVARLLDAPSEPHLLNVGTGVATSITQALSVVRAVSGKSTAVTYLPGRATDVQRSVLDTHRLQDLIHFSPRSLEVGVRDTLEVRAHQQPALEPDPLGVASTPLLLTPE
jgi:UDP-glucose 4-epimerase